MISRWLQMLTLDASKQGWIHDSTSSMSASVWLNACVTPLLVLATLLLSPVPQYLLTLWAQSGKTKHRSDRRTSDGVADSDDGAKEAPGYIVPAQIHHARMLPRESRHSFKYPALYYAFELHALERHHMDRTAAFAWTGDALSLGGANREAEKPPARWSITKFHPRDFGRKSFPEASVDTCAVLSGSALLKLMYELRFRGYLSMGPQDVDAEQLRSGICPWKSEVGQVWAIAMPTLFGLAGFNPLTVYYVYRPATFNGVQTSARGPLWLCVLEVHNTFNERHIYICEVGKGDDATVGGSSKRRQPVRAGYDHSWTFARDFHVSPFNDRSGYYRLFLRDMWRPNDATRIPTIDVRLLLLTPATSTIQSSTPDQTALPPLEKKLLATLSSSQASSATPRPLRVAQAISTGNVLSALFQQPFDLFLPVARIMWEAAKLHWKRKLPVYIRPEPSGDAMKKASFDVTKPFDGVGWPVVHNPAEGSLSKSEQQRASRSSGGIFWNDESFVEKACRKNVEKYLERKTRQSSVSVCICANSPQVADVMFSNGEARPLGDEHFSGKKDSLTLYAMSAALFTDLCLYVPSHALLFGSQMERGWGVSSLAAFRDTFSPAKASSDNTADTPSASVRFVRYLRTSYMRWSVKQALRDGYIDSTEADEVGGRLIQEAHSHHPTDDVGYPVGIMLALAAHIAVLRLTAAASNLLHIQYVRRPWAQVSEGIAVLASQT